MVGLGTAAPIVQLYHEKSIILPDVSRVLACLYEKDIKFETQTASYKSLLRLQASSHAPVPFYDGPTFLEESRGICRYIAEKYEPQGYPFLLGKDALERASVEQWLHNEEHAFNPPSRALYCHLAFPLDEEDGDDIDRHTRKLEQVLEVYEQRLSDSRFLAGNKFTLADLVHLPNSHYITASDKFVYLYDTRKNVSRWWEEISTRKSWQQVLRDMKRVEEQNKQEELEKQQRQKEHPRTSGHPIRIYSRKQTSTEPRTVLVPPADTVSSSIVSPLPTDTFPDEALVSSSQTAPTADKTSATISKETTVLNAPDETPPTSVQSTPTISRKHPIPVQSIKDDSYTTAKKPPVADAAKSSTKDASIPEPTVKDLHSRHKPSSSKVVSNNLDVFDYYPSHTDEETPYIEPTPRRTSGTLDAFSGSSIGTGHTKTSSISAEEEPDQPSASDFYKNDSGATGIDSGYKESIPYSGHTLPKFEPADTSASKPHTTGGRRRLAEQWHTATTGLNDLKQDADHQMSTQQGKPTKDLKQYPPQDSEQATSHPVPEEPMSIKLVQRRENITLRPYTDQRSRGIVEDKAYSDQRSALPLPYTQEHDATPSRQESAKDARGRIPSQAGYPGGQDTNKQPRGPASVPRQRAAQDARGTFGESKAADSTISSESFPNATQSSLRRQDLDGARHTTTPFKKRYSGMEDTSKQAKDKISTPWQMVDKDTEDTTKDTKISDSSSSQVQPSHFQGTDAPSWKQEITEHRHSATSAIQERHADVEDTTGISRDIDFKIDQAIGQDDQDTFKETKSDGPSFLRNEQSDTWQAASTLPEQELNPDGRSEAPPVQRRYPSSTRPSKTRYQIAKDAIKQPRETAPTPKKKAAQDDSGTSEESNTAGEGASTKQPLNAWRAPSSPQIQEVKNSSRTNTSLPKRYPDDDEDLQVADTASASRQIEPDGDNDLSDETKPLASTTTSAKPLYTQQGALPLPRQVEVEDAQSKGRQSRVTIPEPQKIVARDARGTHGERKTATPEHKTRFDFSAEEPYRKDTIDDQKLVPPLLRKEPTSQVQPTSESLQEAASHGGSSTEPSIIEQWQRASVPLNDVTSSSGDDKIAMATIDQKLTPMSQQASPSVKGVNQMAKESGEQRVEQHVPTEAETSGVQSAPTSFPGASTAHHATTDDKFAKQSIIDERVGEQTKMQAPSPDFAPAHTKRATPDGHEISDPELVSTPDGQISEAAKSKHDQAILQEVRDANLRTHNVAKDTFKEKKVVDSTPSSAKPMYTQQSAPTPRHAELEDTRDLGTKRRETVPEQQKMVERRAGTGGKQLPDRLKPIPPSTQATTEDALGAAGDLIRSPDILDTSKKSRGKYEEAKGPGLTLSEEKSLGAQDAQRTIGESITPTAGQRKDDSIKPQPDVQDGLKESKLSVSDWNGLGSLSSEGKDAVGTETTITGDKPERRRETTPPKTRPAYSQGLVKEQTSSIYQKKPLVAQDIQEQAQTIRVGAKAGGSTPKHQQPSDAPDIFYEKLNASEPARAKTHDDFSAEEPYGDVSSDDHKVAPPLLSGQLTSQVQPPLKPSHDATLHHIDEWQHASAPLHGQKPTLMKQQESGGERVEPPVPIEAEKSSVQHASSPFPGASVHDHATIGDKFAKQSITDERVEKPTQMQTSSPDAHPASESTERATREGHEIGDLELVSTPDGQILEATKARDDPATVHEDGHDVNLSTHDVGKDSFKETKVAESTPSSAKPMYTQQPAITPSRQTNVGEARDKSMQSRETIPEQQKMVGRKTGISGEQSSDRQKAIPSPRQVAAVEDAPTGDTIQSPYIPDISNESIGTFKEAIGPGSTLPKAQALDAQDSQLTRGESTMPTAEQRKGWKDANNDEEKSFSTKRLREMFPESKSSTQPTDSQGYSMVAKMSPLYQKGPLPAQESQEEAQIIQAGEKTPEHQESSGAPYTYDEKLSASAPARADIHDDHSAEEPYKKYTADDQKVTSSLSSKEPSSQVQPLSEPLQRAVPDGDMPSKSSTIAQWQRTSPPLYGVNTDSGDAEVAMSSNNDQKLRPSQEATLSPPVPELSRVGRTAPSVPEAARADDATANDKFPKQSNIDERVGSPKQMQQPIKTAHPASASTKRTTPDEADVLKHVRTPERHRLEAAKATQHPAKIHLDVHDASLSTHDAAIDEKTATYHANGDEPITGYVRDRQAQPPTSTQAQPTVETTHDPDSFQYVHTGDSRKIESGKPIVTDQEPTAPIPGSISMDPQREGTLPAEGGHSGQRSTLSDKESARAAPPFPPVEPIKADSNVSAADYVNAPQMIFRQQARPSEPSIIGIPASDTQGVIQKIQQVTPDDRPTDDSDAPQGTEPGKGSAQSVQPPFSTEPTEESTVATPLDQTKDTETITHQQAIIPAPETTKTTFQGANQEAMTPIVGPTSMDPQFAGTLPAEVAHSEQKPTPSDKGSARSAQLVSPVEPIKADNVSASDYTNTPQRIFRQQARPSEPSTIGIPASGTQGAIRKIQQVTSDDRPTDDSDVPQGTEPGKGSAQYVQPPFSTEPTKENTVVNPPDQTKDTDTITRQQAITPAPETAKTTFPGAIQEAMAPIASPTSMDPQLTGTLPAEVAHSEQKHTPSDKGSAHAAQPVSPVEPIKANNNVSASDYTNAPQMIFRQQAKPSEPSTIGIPALGTQGAIRKIQEVTSDGRTIDDSDAPQGKASAQSVQPPFSTEPTEESTVATPPDQTNDTETITHQQAITPAPETTKTTFQGAYQEAMTPIAGPTSMDPQFAGTLPAEVAHSEQKPTPSDKGSARAAQLVSPVEPIKADSNVSASDYTNTPQRIFRQQARPSEPSTIGIPASGTQGVIRKIQEVTPDDRLTDDSGKPFVPSEEQVSRASQAIAGQKQMASLSGATVSSTSDAQVASSEVQEVSPDNQQAVESTTPLLSSGKQGSHVESAFRPGEVGAGEMKVPPSDQELSHSAEQPTSSKPNKEQTVAPTAKQIKEQPTIIDQQNTPYREPWTSDDMLDTTPTHGNVHPASSTEPDSRPLSVQGEEPKFATQAPPPHVAKDSLDPDDIITDQAMAPIMSPSVPSVAPLGTLSGTNSVQPPRQASMPSTVDLESVPETQHGIPEGESTPAEQTFVISDKEPAHTSEPPSSAELRKEEANAAAGDRPNVPQGPETTGRHQPVEKPSPDAREALRKDQKTSHDELHEQTTYAVLPSDLYDRPTPQVDGSVVDKETTLLSSQAQTSVAEPDLTPISGDVSPTSSRQNQDAQPPVTTQAPTTQSLQGSAPTHDDSFRKFEAPRQASTNQVMEPVTSSAAPSDAPQGTEPGQDSAEYLQPPFSTDPKENNTVVTPPDQTKDMETITHQQSITPAPETAKTIFPGANQEAMAPIAGPTSMDPQLAGTLPAEVAHSEQKPTPSDKGSVRAAQPVSPVEPKKADSNVSSADYTNAPQMVFRQQARPSAPSTTGISASDTQGVIGKIQEVTPDNRRAGDSGKSFVRSKEQVLHASQAIPGQEEMASLPSATVAPTSDALVGSSEVQEVSPDDEPAAFGPGEVGAAEKKFSPSDQELPHSAEQPTSGKPIKEQLGIPTAEQIKEEPTMIDQQNTLYTSEPRTPEGVLDTTPSHGDVLSTGSIEPERRPLSVQGGEPKSATEAHPPRVAKDSLDTEAISTNASVQSWKPSTNPDARGATHGELAVAEQKSSPSGQDSAYPANPPSSDEPRIKEVGDLVPPAHLSSTTEPRNGSAIVSAPGQAKDSQTIPGQQVRLPAPSSYTQYPSGKHQEDEPADKLREVKSSKPPSVSAPETYHVAAPDQVAIDEEKVSLSGHYPAPAPGTQYGTELHNADVSGQKLSPSVQDSVHSVQPSLFTAPTKKDSVASATDQTSTLEKVIDQNDTTPAPDKANALFFGTPDASRVTQKSTDDDPIDEKLPGQGQVSPSRHVSESPDGHGDDVDKGTTPGSSRVETSNIGPDSTEIGGDARLSSGNVPASSSFPETQDLQGSAYAKNLPTDSLGKFESSGHLSTDEALEPRMSPSARSVAPLGTLSDKEPAHTLEPPSSAEPRKEEANVAAGEQPNVRRGPETTGQHQIKAPSPDAREALRKDQQASRDDDHTSNLADPLVVTEEKASYASQGPSSEVSSAVDKMIALPSNEAQTSSTGPESTPISGDTHLSSDVPATSYLQNKVAGTPAATQLPTPMAPLESASTQNVLSGAPQGTEPDRVSHASEPPFSAAPSNEASYAGHTSESREGGPVVDAKTTLPSTQVQTTNTGSDSTPLSGDVPDSSSLQNQEAQPSATTQAPTVQAEGSASTKNELADSLGDIKSLRQGTNSVQPSEEASFDFSSDEKPTMSQGDQALPNGGLPTSQVVGQSESADSKGMDSLKNLKGASTDENPKMLQQIEQFSARSYNGNNKEAHGTVRSSTSEEPQKQSSWPKASIGSSDEPENQQTDRAIVQSLEGNGNQAEQTKARDTETGGPEETKALKNTNQKNNRISQVETSDRSGKEASGVQLLGESTRDAPNSTVYASGNVQAIGKPKERSRSSEESKVQLQSEDETGETEAPRSETGQPREGDRPANSYQKNSSQSQAEALDRSAEQSYPGTQNKDTDSRRMDDSTEPSKPGDMDD